MWHTRTHTNTHAHQQGKVYICPQWGNPKDRWAKFSLLSGQMGARRPGRKVHLSRVQLWCWSSGVKIPWPLSRNLHLTISNNHTWASGEGKEKQQNIQQLRRCDHVEQHSPALYEFYCRKKLESQQKLFISIDSKKKWDNFITMKEGFH